MREGKKLVQINLNSHVLKILDNLQEVLNADTRQEVIRRAIEYMWDHYPHPWLCRSKETEEVEKYMLGLNDNR